KYGRARSRIRAMESTNALAHRDDDPDAERRGRHVRQLSCRDGRRDSAGEIARAALRTERPGRVAATAEPRDRRSCKTAPQPYRAGVGDEYADGDRQTPPMNSRLTGDRQTPNRRREREPPAKG